MELVISMTKKKCELLKNLPVYGDSPEQFSATGQGMHREGVAVRFFPESGREWVGNFQRGLTKFDKVYLHPNGKTCFVISGGEVYEVEPEDKTLLRTFGGDIDWAYFCWDLNVLILGTGVCFYIIHSKEEYDTRRLSWDGVRNVKVTEKEIISQAWAPGDSWHSFSVNLFDGQVSGGSYNLDE